LTGISFLTRLFGSDPNGPSRALKLDLKRLTAVAFSMGESHASLGLKGLGPADQLHRLNRHLGDRLGGYSARERASIQEKIASADKILPTEVRMAKSPGLSPEAQDAIASGCADLGRPLRDEQIHSIHAHLKSKHVLLCHDAHIGGAAVSSLVDVPADQNYACYEYLDLWSSPHILEYATQDRILDLAQAYLGCTPTLYSINAFWSFPNRQPHPYSQLFHRDWEDYRSLVVFTLLTPVETPEEGAHYYVEASHDLKTFQALLDSKGITSAEAENLLVRDGAVIAPTAMKLFEHSARRFDGPAGMSFCGDGYGLHRAVVPRSRPRLLLWFRFGNFYNETMYKVSLRGANRDEAQRALQRIPNTPRHRYVFRYMVNALSSV
jgi:hypothetical protein